MNRLASLDFVWTGAHMQPADYAVRRAAAQYQKDQTYKLVADERVTEPERGFYFRCVRAAWRTIHEDGDRFPTAEHLRKAALIKCNHYKVRYITCENAKQAERVSANVTDKDEYSVVDLKGNVVAVYTAISQSNKPGGLTIDEWRRTRDDVMDSLAQMLGVSREVLERQGHEENE